MEKELDRYPLLLLLGEATFPTECRCFVLVLLPVLFFFKIVVDLIWRRKI